MQLKSTPFGLLGNSTADVDTAYFINPLIGLDAIQTSPEAKNQMVRTSEIVFACLDVLGNSAMNVKPAVLKRRTVKIELPDSVEKLKDRTFETGKRQIWEEDMEHPLAQLLRRPNPVMTGTEFLANWIRCKHTAGFFAAEIEYESRQKKAIKNLWPLEPERLKISKYENKVPVEFKYQKRVNGGYAEVTFKKDEVFYDAWPVPTDWYYKTISPLEVAMGAAETDRSQTMYIRGFFKNSGVPSGLLKILNKTLKNHEADRIKRRFMNHFSQRSGGQHSPVVLDQNADYTPMGAKLSELEAENTNNRIEAKICMCFGVPPGLIWALVGISNSSYATQTALLPDFWAVKGTPMFGHMAEKIMWDLLPIYESEDKIRSNKIQFGWDLSGVKALQEDQEKFAKRVTLLYEKSIITKATAQEVLGFTVDPLAGHYLMNVRTTSMYPDIAAIDAATFGSIPAIQSISVGDPSNPPDPDAMDQQSQDNVDANDQLKNDPAATDQDPANADNPAGSEPT